jgi:hypothetical protein
LILTDKDNGAIKFDGDANSYCIATVRSGALEILDPETIVLRRYNVEGSDYLVIKMGS